MPSAVVAGHVAYCCAFRIAVRAQSALPCAPPPCPAPLCPRVGRCSRRGHRLSGRRALVLPDSESASDTLWVRGHVVAAVSSAGGAAECSPGRHGTNVGAAWKQSKGRDRRREQRGSAMRQRIWDGQHWRASGIGMLRAPPLHCSYSGGMLAGPVELLVPCCCFFGRTMHRLSGMSWTRTTTCWTS